jgi:excisionase family DNA binding protein
MRKEPVQAMSKETPLDLQIMEPFQRIAWGLHDIANATGLSMGFLRNEVRAGRLSVRRFGRRVLVRDEDLKSYLDRGSERSRSINLPSDDRDPTNRPD